MSCLFSGVLIDIDLLGVGAATVVNRLGVGEGVLRRDRSRGRTTCNGVVADASQEILTGSVGGEGVRFRTIRLPF